MTKAQLELMSPLALRNLRSAIDIVLKTLADESELHKGLEAVIDHIRVLDPPARVKEQPEAPQYSVKFEVTDDQVILHAKTMADHAQTRKQLGDL